MRFITEFELEYPYKLGTESGCKERAKYDMGGVIQEVFDWKDLSFRGKDDFIEKKRWSLEIEAFPMDKWVEFKQKLFIECGMPEPNGVAILEMIKDLEFYTNNKAAVDSLISKPSGDGITNQ